MQLQKAIVTIKDFKKTAYHHYGYDKLSIPKFMYHSFLRSNSFAITGIELKNYSPALDLDPEYRVIKPTIKELEQLRKNKDLPREFYYDKFHNVKKCYIALKGDEIAYIHWVYVKGDANRFLKLSDKVAELNYNTTLPNFRGKRLMAKMLCYILEDLKKEGFERVVGVVNENNPAAIKSALRAGFSIIGNIKTIGPFSRKVKV